MEEQKIIEARRREAINKKAMIFISFVFLITLLTTVISATFAYFSAGIKGDAQDTIIETAGLASAIFSGESNVKVDPKGIYPGWIGVQTFKIMINESSKDDKGRYLIQLDALIDKGLNPTDKTSIQYSIYKTTDPFNNYFSVKSGELDMSNNQYVKQDFLVEGANTDMVEVLKKSTLTSGNEILLDDVTFSGVDPDTTYYVIYEFNNEDIDQSHAMSKTFSTTIGAVPAPLK